MSDWPTVLSNARRTFHEAPWPHTEEAIRDEFQSDPERVATAIDELAADLANGVTVRSPWAVLRKRLDQPQTPKDGWLSGLKRRLAKPLPRQHEAASSNLAPSVSECVSADKHGVATGAASTASEATQTLPSQARGAPGSRKHPIDEQQPQRIIDSDTAIVRGDDDPF